MGEDVHSATKQAASEGARHDESRASAVAGDGDPRKTRRRLLQLALASAPVMLTLKSSYAGGWYDGGGYHVSAGSPGSCKKKKKKTCDNWWDKDCSKYSNDWWQWDKSTCKDSKYGGGYGGYGW